MVKHTLIGPSILAADFLRLAQQLSDAEDGQADFIHVDVMDGRFVPNISIGLPILEAVRRGTTLPLDVHLMIVEPERWVERFAKAGASRITFHIEACTDPQATLAAIVEAGAVPGVALNPSTSLTLIEEILPFTDQIVIMSVTPGYGGQRFLPSSLDRIRRVRALVDKRNAGCRLEVD
nr:ribulose-phosphate 3-epimerase [Chloroflexota bacterium]